MKKVLFTIAAAVMMFAATSCKKENVNEPENFNREPEANEFLASVNGGATTQNAPRVNDGMGTMATFDPETLTQVMWQVGDVITVNGVEFTCTTNPGKGENFDNRAYFENETLKTIGFHASEYHAFYSTTIESMTLVEEEDPTKGVTGVLSATQYYNPERQAENLPMYAHSTDHWLNFSNICAAIKIYVPCTANHIVISNTSKPMNGGFTVQSNVAVMDHANAESLVSEEKKITIYKGTQGNTKDFHACDSLFIAIPAGTYEGFEIAFYENAGDATPIYTTGPSGSGKNLTVAANKIYRIVGYKYPNHLLPGKFTLANSSVVQFTTGNLTGTNGNYAFASNQTESGDYYEHNNVGATQVNPYSLPSAGSWMSLLGTSKTSGSNRQNAEYLRAFAKVNDGSNDVWCLVVAPDGATAFNPNRHNYTLKEVNSMGLLCLPITGYYDGDNLIETVEGYLACTRYWSSSSTGSYLKYYQLGVSSSYNFDPTYCKGVGDDPSNNYKCPIRLVRTPISIKQ